MNLVKFLTDLAWSQTLAKMLVASLWQNTLIAVALFLTLFAMKRNSAQQRYLVSSIALLSMIVFPVVTALGMDSFSKNQSWLAISYTGRIAFGFAPNPGLQTLLASLNFIFVLGWEIGVSLMSWRLIRDWLAVRKLRMQSPPSVEFWQERTAELAIKMGIDRIPQVLESVVIASPATVGWLKSFILLPVGIQSGLSSKALDALILHELAHIRRHDFLVNLVQTAIETLLFYHPAVWLVSKRIRLERESCCDDLTVKTLGETAPYLRALMSLEELIALPKSASLSANGSDLPGRVRRLAGKRESNSSPFFLILGAPILILLLLSGSFLPEAFARKASGGTQITPSILKSQKTERISDRNKISIISDTKGKQETFEALALLQDNFSASQKTPTGRAHGTSSKRQAENRNSIEEDIQINVKDSDGDKQNEIEISQNGFPIELKTQILAEVRKGLKEAEIEMKKAGFTSKLSRKFVSAATANAMKEAENSIHYNSGEAESTDTPDVPEPPESDFDVME